MNKWTPGPWIPDDNEGFGAWTIWERMAPSGNGTPGKALADVIGDSAETDANAHLIAAAPELYEALAWADQHLTILYPTGAKEGDPLCVAIRAALAKARGEE